MNSILFQDPIFELLTHLVNLQLDIGVQYKGTYWSPLWIQSKVFRSLTYSTYFGIFIAMVSLNNHPYDAMMYC